MKLSIILLLIIYSFTCYSQSVFKKKYFIPKYIYYSDSDAYKLKQTAGKSNGAGSKDSLKMYNLKLDTLTFDIFNFGKKRCRRVFGKTTYIKANVKFEGNNLFVNPWLIKYDNYRDSIYHFELNNRQSIKLPFQQLTFNTITIPLKVRFTQNNSIRYATELNIGVFIGYSWGWTRFTHRRKIGNYVRSWEVTVGAGSGISSIEIDDRNTVASSYGIGILFAYNKINFGIMGGYESAFGSGADAWESHNRPWLGLVAGYSLFNN